MRIVPFEHKHIVGAHEVEKECFDIPWTEEQLEEELYNPNAMFFVAELDASEIEGNTDDLNKDILVAGYVGMHKIIDEGHITNLGVRRDYRRKHVASGLLAHLIEQCKKAGVTKLTLEVRVSNISATKLYTSFGFKPEGVRRRFYPDGEDAYILWKRD